MFKKIKNLKEKTNQTSGITLVALIITIIVLIILAGVTISIALGENGIFRKSKKAASEYQKSAEREETEMDKALIYMGEKPEFNAEELKIGEAINADKYGQKVTGYNVETEETGGWRLFYQDNRYTYLISDNLSKEKYNLGNNLLEYASGANVSTVGQKLNPMLLANGTFFTTDNTNPNILATAYLTDPSKWTKYKNEDAEFAIGSPTVELYAASFNATARYENSKKDITDENKRIEIPKLVVEKHGYNESTDEEQLKIEYNKGIYNKEDSGKWWLASPDGANSYTDFELDVNNTLACLNRTKMNTISYAVRPIVCIQTSVFEVQYTNSLTNE